MSYDNNEGTHNSSSDSRLVGRRISYRCVPLLVLAAAITSRLAHLRRATCLIYIYISTKYRPTYGYTVNVVCGVRHLCGANEDTDVNMRRQEPATCVGTDKSGTYCLVYY